jgi:hypothetical protein
MLLTDRHDNQECQVNEEFSQGSLDDRLFASIFRQSVLRRKESCHWESGMSIHVFFLGDQILLALLNYSPENVLNPIAARFFGLFDIIEDSE